MMRGRGLRVDIFTGRFAELLKTRVDFKLDSFFVKGASEPGLPPARTSPSAGPASSKRLPSRYQFVAKADELVRVWIDENLVIDTNNQATTPPPDELH